MTKEEQAKLNIVANDLAWVKLNLTEKCKNDSHWQDKIDKHLEQLNSKVMINSVTLFGRDGDEGLIHKVYKVANTAMKNRVFFIALIALLIGMGVLEVVDIIHVFGW